MELFGTNTRKGDSMRKLCIILMGLLTITFSYARQAVVQENDQTFAHIPAPLKQARWIWPDPAHWYDIVNCYAVFRDTFNLDEVPDKAVLYITADQLYKLYINGEYVARGPARGHQENWPYDELDVAKYLKKGKNVIAVRAYNGGKSTFSYVHQSAAGLLYALDLGKGKLVLSRGTVKCMREQCIDRNAAQAGMQLNYQEHIDMRKEFDGWTEIDYDDSGWGYSESKGSRVYNSMPHYNLQARGTPMNEEYVLPAPKIIAETTGKVKTSSEIYRNINELFDTEPANPWKASEGTAENMQVKASADGEFRSYILDFGHTVVGMPILEVKNADGGEIIDMMASEYVDENFNIKNDYKQHCKPACSNRMICRPGDQKHEFFSIYGMRYVELRVRSNKNSNMKLSFTVRWSNYPLGKGGVFETSDKLANDIWKISVHTQRCCAMDGYVDTPHREQAQWWGDARVQAWNTFFISGDPRLLRRGIRIISQQTLPNGLTYGHAPTMAHNCILPDFSLTWMLTIWDYFWQTGNPEPFVAHKNTIKDLLTYFDSQTDPKTGLLKFDPRYWLFLDWCSIQKEGQPAIYNLLYLHAQQRMAELCRISGFKEDASFFETRAKRIEDAIVKNLLDSEGLVHDGILPDGKQNPNTSVQAQTLAKMCNLKGFNFEKALEKILVPFIKNPKPMRDISTRNMIYPSSFWVVYVLQVLDEAGYSEDVYNFYKRNWDIMVPYGGTYEGYTNSNSLSHAWTAHPAFMLPRVVGGVRQTSPGWKTVSFNPAKFVDSAKVVYPTPQGDIKVEIKKNAEGKSSADIVLPDGVTLKK